MEKGKKERKKDGKQAFDSVFCFLFAAIPRDCNQQTTTEHHTKTEGESRLYY